MNLGRWIRRRRIAWLERRADDLERDYAGTISAVIAKAEANSMRRKAAGLRRSLR